MDKEQNRKVRKDLYTKIVATTYEINSFIK